MFALDPHLGDSRFDVPEEMRSGRGDEQWTRLRKGNVSKVDRSERSVGVVDEGVSNEPTGRDGEKGGVVRYFGFWFWSD